MTAAAPSPVPAPAASAGAPPAQGVAATIREMPTLLERVRTAAAERHRPDLAERMDIAIARHLERELTVLVVGEFKQGKSTLVNALLNAAVCGVADDVSTVVPTLVRYGADPTALVVFHDGERRETVAFERATALSCEQGNPGNRAGLRSIEVAIPRKLLQPGLTIVDTPGVGGLDSTHGAATSAALTMAESVLFVSDTSQPLTATEISFLHTARRRCPNVALVQTKTDIHPSWRAVVAANEAALVAAGLGDVPIMPVSSMLRQRATAQNSSELNDESGYPTLLRYLKDASAGERARTLARVSVGDALFVLEQLAGASESELRVLDDPSSLGELTAELDRAKTTADLLRSTSARWQQTLGDGSQDLTADMDHDLRMRVRTIVAEAETALEANDPSEIWDEFEVWLHQRIGFDLAAHHRLMSERADELAGRVSEHFALDESGARPDVHVSISTVRSRHLGTEIDLERPGLSGNALAAVRGSYGGLLMFGMVGQMVGLAMLNPFSIVVGLGLGRRSLREERKRQLLQRQQMAKISVRKYLDDVNVEAGKVSRDTIRTIHRRLRDEFTSRAEQLQTTIRDSLRAAEVASKERTVGRAQRISDLRTELAALDTIRTKVTTMASRLGPVPS